MTTIRADKMMKILLQLIALHSFFVGILLIVLPSHYMELFGYSPVNEPFFQVQGGVFHIVMVFAYVMASKDIKHSSSMILFIILAKMTATAFLISYYIFISHILTVFLSGIGDFLMGLFVFLLHKQLVKEGSYV